LLVARIWQRRVEFRQTEPVVEDLAA